MCSSCWSYFLSFRFKDCVEDILIGIRFPRVCFFSAFDQVGISIMVSICYWGGASLMRSKSDAYLWVWDKYSESGRSSFPLGSITSSAGGWISG